jgi:hypothetical protein
MFTPAIINPAAVMSLNLKSILFINLGIFNIKPTKIETLPI